MPESILVVHGVANHDTDAFKAMVAALQERAGPAYRLVAVFWGDLAGNADHLRTTLPVLFPSDQETRGVSTDDEFIELLLARRDKLMGAETVRGNDAAEAIYRAMLASGGAAGPLSPTRRSDPWHDALLAQVPHTRYLKHLSDPDLLQAVGELLADFTRGERPADPGVGTLYETRGWIDESKDALMQCIAGVDRFVGKISTNIAGSANQWMRGMLAEPFALTLGDVVAYHQNRKAIHERLFEVIDREAPGEGTADQPITVLAHSLGGLLILDAALGSEVTAADGQPRRLHLRHWITCGSQPAFFHVLAPRVGIKPYSENEPAVLPDTIGRWTNLWHPMDPLAFTAAPVFRLQGNVAPSDMRIDSPASELLRNKFWFHSIYWTSPQLLESLKSGHP